MLDVLSSSSPCLRVSVVNLLRAFVEFPPSPSSGKAPSPALPRSTAKYRGRGSIVLTPDEIAPTDELIGGIPYSSPGSSGLSGGAEWAYCRSFALWRGPWVAPLDVGVILGAWVSG